MTLWSDGKEKGFLLLPVSWVTSTDGQMGLKVKSESKDLLVPPLVRSWSPLVVGGLLGLCVVLLSLVQSFFAGDLIEAAQAGRPVLRPLAVVTSAAVASAVVAGAQQFVLGKLTEDSVAQWRRWILAHFFALPVLGRQSRTGGWFSSRLIADPPVIGEFVGSRLVQAFQSGVALVGSITLLLWTDVVTTMVPVVLASLGVCCALVLAGPSGRMRARIQEQNTQMSGMMDTAVRATKLLVASNADETQRRRLVACVEDARREGIRLNAVYSVLGPITSTLMQVAYASVFVVGGWRVASGHFSFADFITFLMLFNLFQDSVQELVSVPGGISECRSAVEHLAAVRRLGVVPGADAGAACANSRGVSEVLPVVSSEGDGSKSAPAAAPRHSAGRDGAGEGSAVTFRDVSFTYPHSHRPVLDRVTLTVPSRGLCVLVGPSGGGKSTCLGLVEGFFAACDGDVSVLGCPISEGTASGIRDRVGYVDQDSTLLPGTVLDNLAFGASSSPDEEAMMKSLKEVGLWRLFSKSGGLSATVGVDGLSLSGGQRQRLAIARALLRQPELLVLDEPTSNLDGMAEAQVRTLLKRMSVSRAVLLTAHRLSTILEADRVVVLQGGQVVGEGAHDDLMVSCSYYRELVFSQTPGGAVRLG